jgi:heme-degrading monooxygenase HmoA
VPANDGRVGRSFEDRFASRVHLVDQAPGFIRNEVLRPAPRQFDHASGRWVRKANGGVAAGGVYRISTWWATLQDFEAWTRSPAFAEAHNSRPPAEMFSGPARLEIHEVYLSTDEGLEPVPRRGLHATPHGDAAAAAAAADEGQGAPPPPSEAETEGAAAVSPLRSFTVHELAKHTTVGRQLRGWLLRCVCLDRAGGLLF